MDLWELIRRVMAFWGALGVLVLAVVLAGVGFATFGEGIPFGGIFLGLAFLLVLIMLGLVNYSLTGEFRPPFWPWSGESE